MSTIGARMNPGTQSMMQDLLEQAQKVQEQIEAMRVGLEEVEVTGASDGAKVTVTMTATGVVRSLRISADVVNPDNVGALEGLVVSAMNDAHTRIEDLTQQAI